MTGEVRDLEPFGENLTNDKNFAETLHLRNSDAVTFQDTPGQKVYAPWAKFF